MKEAELLITEFITFYLVAKGSSSFSPAGDHLKALPSASALAFQVYTAGKGRAHSSVREYGIAAFRALEPEQSRVVTDGAHKGTKPYWIRCHFGHPTSAGVGHLHVQRSEIETVVVLPVFETLEEGVRVLVEQFGVEQLLGGRTHGALQFEEVVLFHDTDFF